MSSNAFARSRPRVRHQRVPKSQTYNHPRFLQLCQELTRLDELKRNVDGFDSDKDTGVGDGDVGSDSCGGGGGGGGSSGGVSSKEDCCATKCQGIVPNRSNNNCSTATHDLNNSNYCNDSRAPQAQQAMTSCASVIDNFIEAHTSNGFRSLACTSSAGYDEYYRQSNTNIIQNHQHYLQDRCANNLSINPRQYHLHEPNQFNDQSSGVNNAHQLLQPGCLNKFAPMSTYQMSNSPSRVNQSKLVAPIQGSDLTTTSRNDDNLDLNRQDENRSKRKRSSNDSSSHGSKKLSSTNGSLSPSCLATGKRHRSSTEPLRPLSPSFTKCPICLLDCMDRDPSFTNTCFHLFCFVCIENWSKSKATCPLCRTKFNKIIYNIKSAGCFEEKIASRVIQRDDDDDRIIYEHMLMSSNPMAASHQAPLRNQHQNETSPRLSFDNIRTSDVLMPPFPFNPQLDYHPLESLHPFNTISNSNTVTHTSPFSNYNPYILIPTTNPSARLHQPATSTAITSAYVANPGTASLNSVINNSAGDSSSGDNSNSSNRMPRMSRSGRCVHSRAYNLTSTMHDSNSRTSRSSNPNIAPGGTSITLERHHYNVQPSNQHNRHSVVVGVSPPVNLIPRSTSSTLTMNALPNNVNNSNSTIRHSGHRTNLHPYTNLPYSIAHPLSYSRRPYVPVEQHLFNSIYGASQEPM